MKDKKNNEYRELFNRMFSVPIGKQPLVVTVDHVYSSPPVRLLETYLRLSKMREKFHIIPIVWDISIPLMQTKRYDLFFDVGLVTNMKEQIVFKPDIPSYKQKAESPNFKLIEEKLVKILQQLKSIGYLDRGIEIPVVLCNYREVCKTYTTALNHKKPFDFYKQLQESFAELLGTSNEVKGYFQNALSYAESVTIHDFIRTLLKNEKESDVFPLKMRGNVFQKSLINLSPDLDLRLDANDIIDMTSEMGFYSYELLFWALALAGVSHFGNDYSFFYRFGDLHNPDIKKLQLTEHNRDGYNLVEFLSDPAFIETGGQFRKITSPTKTSRINSFTALYILLGERIAEIAQLYLKRKDEVNLIKVSYAKQ